MAILYFNIFLQNQSHVTLYYHQASHDLRRFIQNWHHNWLIEERALANELMIGKLLPTEVLSASYQVRYEFWVFTRLELGYQPRPSNFFSNR